MNNISSKNIPPTNKKILGYNIGGIDDVVNSNKKNNNSLRISTNVQVIRGAFSKEDFKEIAKQTFAENRAISEIILMKDCKENHNVVDLISREVSISYPESAIVFFLLKVINNEVASIDVIVTDVADNLLTNLLNSNNNIIRVAK